MLPDGWKRRTVADICNMQNGNGFGPQDWGKEGYPIIRIQNLNGGSNFDFYSGPVKPRWLVETGQLLFAWAGTKGVSFGPTIWKGRTGVLNQHIFKVNAQDGIDKNWLYWALRHVTDRIETNAHGFKATLVHVKKSDIDRQEVLVPDLPTQCWIVQVLQVWEDAITATNKLLASSSKQKDALISKLVMPVPASGRGRRVGDAFPASVQPGIPQLPPTPAGWRKATLGQFLKEVPRPVALEPDKAYTLITVRRSRGGVDERGVLLGNEIKTPSQFRVKTGDFLISKRQIVHGACGIVPPNLDGAIVSNEYAVLNTFNGLDTRFLAYLAETTYFQQTCFHSSIGVHVEKMIFKLDRWLTWPFNIPPVDVQQRIVAQIDLATNQIRSAERQLELLKQEKRALMADLLIGKRRVYVPETSTEAEAT